MSLSGSRLDWPQEAECVFTFVLRRYELNWGLEAPLLREYTHK
jgi:hypothetical protein